MKTNVHLWTHLAEFFLEWEMFQTNFVGKIKTHILFSITFLLKSCRLWDNVEILEEPETPEMTIKTDACALRAGLLRLNTQTDVQNIEHFLLSAAKRFRQRARILRLFPDCLSFECYGGSIIYLHLHITQCLFFCQHLACDQTGRDATWRYQCYKTKRHFRSFTAVLSTFRPSGTQQLASLRSYKLY